MTDPQAQLSLAGPFTLWVLKATLLLTLAFVASLLWRTASAAQRHFAWALTFLGLILLLPLSLLSARSDVWSIDVPIAGIDPPVDATTASPSPSVSTASRSQARPTPRGAGERNTQESAIPDEDVRPTISAASSWLDIHWSRWALALWVVGFLGFTLRLAAGLRASLRVRQRAQRLSESSWDELLASACKSIGVRRSVELRVGKESQVPMTLGFVLPAILVPADARSYTVERRRSILLHELAHVRRADCLTQLMSQLVCALYWWHPLTWIAARKMRSESERASDDLVLAAGAPASDYAHDLLEMARGLTSPSATTPIVSVTMAHRGTFEERLLAILDPKAARRALSRTTGLVAAAMGLLLLVPLGLLKPGADTARAASLASPIQTQPQSEPSAPDEDGVEMDMEMELDAQEDTEQSETQQSEAASRAREALFQALDDTNPEVREEARKSLTQLGDERIVPYLVDALQDEDPQARSEAAWGLGQMQHAASASSLAKALGDAEAEVREQAAWALGMIQSEASAGDLARTLSEDAEPSVREQAAWALGMIQSEIGSDALENGLKDASADVREQAAWALGMIESKASVPQLIAAQGDESDSVREEAAWALGMIQEASAADALARALTDTSDSVREQAIWALGMLQSPEAVPALIAALQHPEADIRSEAAWALGMIADPRAIDGLAALLKDENEDVREQAAWALGQLARGISDDDGSDSEPEEPDQDDPDPDPDPGPDPAGNDLAGEPLIVGHTLASVF